MKYVAVIGALVVLLGVIGAGPLLTIASLNTLFGLNIAYTLGTYFSVMWGLTLLLLLLLVVWVCRFVV